MLSTIWAPSPHYAEASSRFSVILWSNCILRVPPTNHNKNSLKIDSLKPIMHNDNFGQQGTTVTTLKFEDEYLRAHRTFRQLLAL